MSTQDEMYIDDLLERVEVLEGLLRESQVKLEERPNPPVYLTHRIRAYWEATE